MTTFEELRAIASMEERRKLDLDLQNLGVCFAESTTTADGRKVVVRLDPRRFIWRFAEKRWYLHTRDGVVPIPESVAVLGGVN